MLFSMLFTQYIEGIYIWACKSHYLSLQTAASAPGGGKQERERERCGSGSGICPAVYSRSAALYLGRHVRITMKLDWDKF